MTDPGGSPSVETLVDRLERGDTEGVSGAITAYADAEPERRAELLRRLRSLADEDAGLVSPLAPSVGSFLTDEERSVRLSTAKLFVALSRDDPGAVVGEAERLAERVADDGEFYYVRARAAEALGYVATEYPEAVATPELLADLRIGLSFDEPEVKAKLAKALAYVAVGNPDRLRHRVADLAEHLDDADELVRYHLATAVVAVGREHPAKIADGTEALLDRLADECAYVRGRAVEAIGLSAAAPEPIDVSTDELTRLADRVDADDDGASFLRERVRFAVARLEDPSADEFDESIGSVETIREETDAIAESIRTPDGDACPNCGLSLPEDGPPMCPQCGSPY